MKIKIRFLLLLLSMGTWGMSQEIHYQKFCQGLSGEPVNALAIAETEEFILAGTDGGNVLEIDPEDCRTLRTYDVGSYPIRTIAIGPYDTYFATGGDDGYLTIWKRGNKNSLDVLVFDDAINKVMFAKNSTSLWVAGLDGNLRAVSFDGTYLKILDKKEGENRHPRGIFDMDMTKAPARVATGGKDNKVNISLLSRLGRSVTILCDDDVNIVRLSEDKDGPFVFVGTDDGKVKIGNLHAGVNSFAEWSGFNAINTASFDHQNDWIYFTTGYEKNIRALPYRPSDTGIQAEPKVWVHPYTYPLSSVIASNKGQLITGGADGNIYLWTIDRGDPVIIWDPPLAGEILPFAEVLTKISVNNVKVKKAKININGIDRDIKQKLQKGNPLEFCDNFFQESLDLEQGDNEILLILIDEQDRVHESLVRVKVDQAPAQNYLMVIGINNYQHWGRLDNAVNDATAVKDLLIEKYQFVDSNTIVLLNEEATEEKIKEKFRYLITKVNPNDNLLIYYAGHGIFDTLENEGAWIPVETTLNGTGAYITNDDIERMIGKINSLQTFVIADACYSGQLLLASNTKTRRKGPTKAEYLQFLRDNEHKKARKFLGSGVKEVNDAGPISGHSPFTGVFLEILRTNNYEMLGGRKLSEDLTVMMGAKFSPLYGTIEGTGDEGGDFIFRLKKK